MSKNVKIAYFLFYSSCQNTKCVLTFAVNTVWKVLQRKKRHLSFKIICKIWTKTVGLDMAKLNIFFHETKQFNIPEKNVPSQTCLTWVSDHFAVGVECSSRTAPPQFAPSLFCSVTHRRGSRQNPAVLPPLHSNMILKMHVKDWIICLLTQIH